MPSSTLGANCSEKCLTKDHTTFGQCMRAKGVRVGWANSAAGVDLTHQKRWSKRLQSYRDAKRQGIQPDGSTTEAIQRALDISDKTGTAYRGDAPALAPEA